MDVFDKPLWPHQQKLLRAMPDILQHSTAIAITTPTGGGKSRCMFEILRQNDCPQILLTHRRGLLEQLAGNLEREGIDFGYRAAGLQPRLSRRVQLAMMQTEFARRDDWPMHNADIVHIDEGHAEKGERGMEICRRYRERGATVLLWTATPLGLEGLAEQLVVAGTNSELRACGALVPAIHYACDEPDCAHIKRVASGEYKYGDVVRAIMSHRIVGRVIDHYHRLNPDRRPTMLFAPGVAESAWFADQLNANGIRAAHIDGDRVVIKGQSFDSDAEARAGLRELVESGDIQVVCNRYVMREGHDWPHISHIIFATIFGTLTGYLQSGGRGLRACNAGRWAGKDFCTIQDHGGNWWRHGSLNSDRDWDLSHTDYMVTEAREERLRRKTERTPIVCPKCNAVRLAGPKCLQCGYQHTVSVRMVVQTDGSLKEKTGDVLRARRIIKHDAREEWRRYYFRAYNSRNSMTFSQAIGLFAMDHNWQWPNPNWPLMPKDPMDLTRSVASVPKFRLIGEHDGTELDVCNTARNAV
jgi:superfamily II DNA or RNA helicase